jgi:hypothetical protein
MWLFSNSDSVQSRDVSLEFPIFDDFVFRFSWCDSCEHSDYFEI